VASVPVAVWRELLSFLSEIVRFIIQRKKFVLGPLIFIFVALGGLLVLTANSAVTPFLYALF